MPLTERLSAALADRYTIERLIGEGGMATVYLARDVRHNRPVALKVLRPDLGAVVGVDRFLAEIEVTANLQHPNLLPLFDSGAAGDQLFYVMPYVQGESLRARLDREKQLPVEEAVRLATAIGGALDYAHRQGVIHRDLKPENVLLQEGQPLVADFGIALAVSNAGGTRITQTGLSLGTPHYMSPEQATGDRVIDGRTDIYSLGALAYEMLTGEPPHVGSTSQAIIARVLTERPRSIRASRPSVPEHVEAAVERALEKLPADRWPSAREFSEALTGARPVTRSATSATTAFPAATGRRSVVRPSLREGVAWTLAAAGIGLGWWTLSRPDAALPPMTRSTLELPDSVVANGGYFPVTPSIAFSHDGSLLAFVASRRATTSQSPPAIYIRGIDGKEARELQGTDFSSNPVFSPDDQSLVFIDRDRALRRIPVSGGPSQKLADSANYVSWADNGALYFTRFSGIYMLPAGNGRERLVVPVDSAAGIVSLTHLQVLPGSESALVRVREPLAAYYMTVVDLQAGRVGDFRLDANSAHYVAPGYLLYQSGDGVLSAVPFSLRESKVTGAPVTVLSEVGGLQNGGLDFGAADNGVLVARTVLGNPLGPTQLVQMDLRGSVSSVLRTDQRYDQPRLSPTGRQAVVRIGAGAYSSGDLWVLELGSGAMTRLTFGNNSYRASWSRDGRKIIYITGNPGTSKVLAKPWDGSGSDSVILDRSGTAEFAEGPPGGWSVLRNYGQRDIFLIPTDSVQTAQPRLFVSGPSNETDIALSPSGRLLAYQSDETGRPEVYLRPVPGPGARIPVSVGGGQRPVWSHDGRTLYYNAGATVMAASVVEAPALAVTRRDSLFVARLATDGVNLAVSPDNRGFLAAIDPAQQVAVPFRLTLITNWRSLFQRSQATPKP